jgi:uncharacterized membrane protein
MLDGLMLFFAAVLSLMLLLSAKYMRATDRERARIRAATRMERKWIQGTHFGGRLYGG